jgi:phosphate transport system substrate-binding protein
MNMKRILAAAALAGFIAGPAALAGRSLTIKGSDTLVILAQRWAEKYMGAHSEVVLQVTGGGSGVGIAALINGTTDIATASRKMTQDEKIKLRDRYQTMGVEIPVAKDGLSVYLNEKSPVRELAFDQLKAIYTGKVSNWKEVGGPDARIVLYGRENSSGT